MKKFTISAIMAMGVVALSSAAFAGTTSANFRGMVSNGASLASDTVVPTDTVVPEQKDTTTKTDPQFCLSDTVVPTDTVVKDQKDQKDEKTEKTEETGKTGETSLSDTVVPADTLTPAKTPAK